MKTWLISLFLLATAHAAPMPGTSSSPLVSGKPGLFMHPSGFTMNSAQTAWIQAAPPKNTPSLVTIYKVGSSRVDLQACKLEYSIVSPK